MLKLNIIKQYYATIIIAITIMVLSLIPVNTPSGSSLLNIPHLDKIAHIAFYTILTLAWLFESKKNTKTAHPYLIIPIVLSVFYGIFIELLQLFIVDRSGEFLDIIADLIGALFAIALFKLYYKFR